MSAVSAEPPKARRSIRQTDVLRGAQRGRDPPRGVEFEPVPLAVVERQGVAFKAVAPRDGQCGSGVETAAQKDDGLGRGGRHIRLTT